MESKRLLGKMNRPLDEYMGGMIDSDSLSGCGVHFSCDKGQSSLLDEIPREEIYDNWVPFGGSAFRQVWGVRESVCVRESLSFQFFKCLRLKIVNMPE